MSGFEDEQAEPPTQFEMHIEPGQEAGVYANLLSVWHSAYEFTLDFASTQPPQPRDPDDQDSPVVVPCRVVSRVKIPPTLIFNVLQALNENMTHYEETFGPIRRPEET